MLLAIVQRGAVLHSREACYPRFSTAVRRHMVMVTLEKENISLELTYSLVHYLHGMEACRQTEEGAESSTSGLTGSKN